MRDFNVESYSEAELFAEFDRLFPHRNLLSLRKPDDDRRLPPEPTLAEIAQEHVERPVETEVEVRELVGLCLWDVFSDEHEVITSDGRRLDLGSFRGSGGFLADVLNRQTGREHYDYLSFYLGTIWVAGRADLARSTIRTSAVFVPLRCHESNDRKMTDRKMEATRLPVYN